MLLSSDSRGILTNPLGNLFITQSRYQPESFKSRKVGSSADRAPAIEREWDSESVFCAEPVSAISAGIEGLAMQDVVMLLFTVVFFAMAFLYVKACQKLR